MWERERERKKPIYGTSYHPWPWILFVFHCTLYPHVYSLMKTSTSKTGFMTFHWAWVVNTTWLARRFYKLERPNNNGFPMYVCVSHISEIFSYVIRLASNTSSNLRMFLWWHHLFLPCPFEFRVCVSTISKVDDTLRLAREAARKECEGNTYGGADGSRRCHHLTKTLNGGFCYTPEK